MSEYSKGGQEPNTEAVEAAEQAKSDREEFKKYWKSLSQAEKNLSILGVNSLDDDYPAHLKELGFSDERIAETLDINEQIKEFAEEESLQEPEDPDMEAALDEYFDQFGELTEDSKTQEITEDNDLDAVLAQLREERKLFWETSSDELKDLYTAVLPEILEKLAEYWKEQDGDNEDQDRILTDEEARVRTITETAVLSELQEKITSNSETDDFISDLIRKKRTANED